MIRRVLTVAAVVGALGFTSLTGAVAQQPANPCAAKNPCTVAPKIEKRPGPAEKRPAKNLEKRPAKRGVKRNSGAATNPCAATATR
jgi:hypothetical protein